MPSLDSSVDVWNVDEGQVADDQVEPIFLKGQALGLCFDVATFRIACARGARALDPCRSHPRHTV